MTDLELIRLYNSGTLLEDIANRADRSLGTINNRLLKLRKAKKIKRRPQTLSKARIAIANERRAVAKKMRNQGRTNAEIADKLGVSVARVQQIVDVLVNNGELEPRINRHC